MKLSKEKIIEAAEAFNRAKSFDEFKVLLDLCDVKLEDFEQDYFEIASATHPVFANMISGFGKYKTFNSRLYMKLDPRKIPGIAYLGLLSRFKLPVWFEKDEFGMVKSDDAWKPLHISIILSRASKRLGRDGIRCRQRDG